ncbi:uncharacterized protein cubi_01756 [Cryptosporidium ubiquitum]|uniref:START domain-containing protein n=1 Tax=Cryptosporidium ubiquitum TaxID=857276 RepID=A0A1J4MAM9_9CRYT|nr:uncharacterized protein cubi_01756 [Cryptosporidium ubiquitum]OII71281.1 hypothetical protein cubi_01756 [Cryptosporidium ubiquitum]
MESHENKFKSKAKITNIPRKPSKLGLETQTSLKNAELRNTLEYTIYNQIKTWKDNKISNKDLEDLDGKYLVCNLEFDEKKNVNIDSKHQDKKKVKASILSPLMFSFTKKDATSLELKESFDDSNHKTENYINKSYHNQCNLENSKIKLSIENLLKLNEILRMNLEGETPTVVSSSETQLELDQSTWDELFCDVNDNSSKIDFLEKLTDQITTSIKSLIMGEALLGADNARQMLIFELKSLQKLFDEDKQEEISKSIECLLAQTGSDHDIKMLIFKIDQIRSALKHFNLSNRFQDFNFGYNNLPNDETEIGERILHTNQTSNFFAKHKLLKINKWHRQSNPSLEKPTSNNANGESNLNNHHFFLHHDGHSHHRHILSHYKYHQHRNISNNSEKASEFGKKEENFDHSPNELDIQPFSPNNIDGWNIEYSKGISLSYKIDSSLNGQLSINVIIKSDIKCKLINLITILNEVELSNMWVPYMSYSKCFYNFSRVSKLVQQVYDLPWPIGQRENIMFCFGVDTLREHNCIMISCGDPQSSKNKFFGVNIPDPPPKVPREKCSYLLFILTPSDNDKFLTTLEMFSSFCVTKYVPVKLASFLIKRMTKKMYTDITNLASNLNGSPYETAYNNNLQLYSWLDMKLTQHYESKQRKSD